VPRQKEVILLHDLIDCVKPGEEVEVTGIYQHTFEAGLNSKSGFPVFTTTVLANYISVGGAYSALVTFICDLCTLRTRISRPICTRHTTQQK
jgi:DNA replicative helicase MCM subunit Mcm2 (Cdc46/Mcm family)